jgi:hypothetical protein
VRENVRSLVNARESRTGRVVVVAVGGLICCWLLASWSGARTFVGWVLTKAVLEVLSGGLAEDGGGDGEKGELSHCDGSSCW